MNRSLLRASALLNLLAVGFALALFAGWLPTSTRTQPNAAETARSAITATPACPEPVCPAATTEPPASGSSPHALIAGTDTLVRRYAVCPHAATSGIELSGANPRTMLAVHCGDHVDLIGFGPAGPERVLHIDKRAGDPKLSWQPAPLLAADVSGDQRDDLLVGFAAADATGGPRGGALLEFVQTEDRGFAPPRLLAPLFVSSLAAGRLDANAGADVLALHREDGRLDRVSQLIALRGGPAPLKMFATDVAADVRSVFAIDLDLDGRDELLLGGTDGPIELLHLGVHSEVAQRETPDAAAIGSLSIADLNGDGAADALVAGAKLWALIATRDRAPTLQVLREPFDASHVIAIDADRDGTLDLIALRADRVVVYSASSPLHFDREPLTIFSAAGFGLDDVVALHTNPPRLAVRGHTSSRTELVFLPLDGVSKRPTLLAEESTWPDAPLQLSFAVP